MRLRGVMLVAASIAAVGLSGAAWLGWLPSLGARHGATVSRPAFGYPIVDQVSGAYGRPTPLPVASLNQPEQQLLAQLASAGKPVTEVWPSQKSAVFPAPNSALLLLVSSGSEGSRDGLNVVFFANAQAASAVRVCPVPGDASRWRYHVSPVDAVIDAAYPIYFSETATELFQTNNSNLDGFLTAQFGASRPRCQ